MTDTFDPRNQEQRDTAMLHDILSRDNGTVLNIVQSASEQQGSLSERFRKALAEFPEAQAEPATSRNPSSASFDRHSMTDVQW